MGSIVSSENEEGEDAGSGETISSLNSPVYIDAARAIDIGHNRNLHGGQAERSQLVEKANQSSPSIPTEETPKRQQGDGMEVSAPTKAQPEVMGLMSASPVSTGVTLPDTGLTLAKLPPILDKVDIQPNMPDRPLVLEKPKVYPKGTYPPATKKVREAKFVPYEPYKAAVTHMQPRKASGRALETKLNLSSDETCRQDFAEIKPEDKVADEVVQGLKELITADESLQIDAKDNDTDIPAGLQENYRFMLDAKENELRKLRHVLESAEKQLKIQTQVNSEIKKLLVASVGEDIEARVDFLTQDKARLAADVLQYNNKISRDWEEKEALHVESDIWRSKFLASTVILDEVTREKAASQARCHQLEHVGRRILAERSDLRCSLRSIQKIVNKLNFSFDPASQAGSCRGTTAGDILQQAESLHQTCQALCDRLIGDKCAETAEESEPAHQGSLTQSEKELGQLLCTPTNNASIIPEQASTSLTKGARSLLQKLGDEAQSPGKSAFNTCSHCNGSVHVV